MEARLATPADLTTGAEVYYVPLHAHGDVNHEAVERGVVYRVTARAVFVRYYTPFVYPFVYSPVLQEQAKATDADDLYIKVAE